MRHTGGLLRRASMVVQSDSNGLEARFEGLSEIAERRSRVAQVIGGARGAMWPSY